MAFTTIKSQSERNKLYCFYYRVYVLQNWVFVIWIKKLYLLGLFIFI